MSLVFASATVRALFASRRFEAAQVQRQYVWGPIEQEALLDDLLAAATSKTRLDYFLGTLLLAEPTKQVSRIYDGQQRLTTIVLLLCALGRRLDRFSEVRRLLIDGEEIRLKIRSSGGYLKKCFNDTEYRTYRKDYIASDWRMKGGYDLFCRRLADLPDRDASQLYDFVLNHVYLATVAARDGEREQMTGIFVRANARGRPLSWADRLKAHITESVMSYASDPLTQEAEFDKFWYRHVVPIGDKERVLLELGREVNEDLNDDSAMAAVFDEVDAWTEDDWRARLSALKARITTLASAAPRYVHLPHQAKALEPTAEQVEAVELFNDGQNLKILAFAGAGKTSTLRMLAEKVTDRAVLYLAYNRRIADEAGEAMPSNTTCQTIHALACDAMRRRGFSQERLAGEVNVNLVADALNLDGQSNAGLDARALAGAIKRCVQAFCFSNAPSIDLSHVSDPAYPATRFASDQKDHIVNLARTLWTLMSEPDGRVSSVPLTFEGTVKAWSLQKPKLPYGVIMIDEAQDMNPAALSVLADQSAQLVFVGDPHQQIYEWRGAVDALEHVDTPATCRLTQSFRFGPAIAAEANKLLNALGETDGLAGNPLRKSRIGPIAKPDVILTRTNAQVFLEAQRLIDEGRSPHIIGRAGQLAGLIQDIERLQRGRPADSAQFYGFISWKEVRTAAKAAESADLRAIVDLVDRFGVEGLRQILQACAQEPGRGTCSIGTAYSVKGQEWDRVRVADDFVIAPAASDLAAAELRLLYVAVTRARIELEVPPGLIEKYCAGMRQLPR